ncbi:MAG: cytochrome-c peroxidase [Flavipsychrobacter sp.]|nr:cytochrome-c peroxidase [Flavipsychrobacter sp.]
MRKPVIIIALLVLVVLASFRTKSTDLFRRPEGWPKPVYNFKKHPLDEQKVMLGRVLFYDPILSKDNTISCNSCHLQATSFTHVDHALSHGVEGKIGTRNAPGLTNLAWSKRLMWDGEVDNIDVQAIKPICNPLEMAETMENVVRKLQMAGDYPMLFYKAFGDSAITQAGILQSLSQFMLTMVSANAKYDRVKRGEEQFSEQENKGYVIFKEHCSTCHTEPLFTNEQFENNGLAVDDELKDIGYMKVTHKSEDSLKFKVPTLRNVQYTYPYMHDGRFKTLSMVLNNYIMGIQQSPSLHPSLRKGIYLSSDQKSDLISFLFTLSDKEFLTDPRFSYIKK